MINIKSLNFGVTGFALIMLIHERKKYNANVVYFYLIILFKNILFIWKNEISNLKFEVMVKYKRYD